MMSMLEPCDWKAFCEERSAQDYAREVQGMVAGSVIPVPMGQDPAAYASALMMQLAQNSVAIQNREYARIRELQAERRLNAEIAAGLVPDWPEWSRQMVEERL